MQYWIMKSGLEVFDVARAYGLATLLSYSDEDQSSSPVIQDMGSAYGIRFPDGRPSLERLTSSPDWFGAFKVGEFGDIGAPQWNNLLITDTAKYKESKRNAVRAILESQFDAILQRGATTGLMAELDAGETLPGGLDPVAFKGLRGRTRGQYTEGQLNVDRTNWALGCLGGALAGRFVYQRNAGYFVIYPVPQEVRFSDFRDVRKETYGERLTYLSVQNAAAHYSVVLAEHLRQRAASRIRATPRYSNVLYLRLFKTGNQWKPGNAGRANLQPLIDLAINQPDRAAQVFKVWTYLFRRGSVRGSEDLAIAITDFIMHPSLDSYEQHVKVFARYLAKGVKMDFQYNEQALKEVTALVAS